MPTLYFMRHGYAERAAGKDDARRQLTPEGVQLIETSAQVFASLNPSLDHVFCSPRDRARQTAEIMAGPLGLSAEVRPELDFSFNRTAVRSFVEQYPDERLMLVGHQPTLSEVVAHITGAMTYIEPGTVLRVMLHTPGQLRGDLIAMIPPDVFSALGR